MEEKASDFYSCAKWKFLCHLRFPYAHNSFNHLPSQYLLSICCVQSCSGSPQMSKIYFHPQAVCSLMERQTYKC